MPLTPAEEARRSVLQNILPPERTTAENEELAALNVSAPAVSVPSASVTVDGAVPLTAEEQAKVVALRGLRAPTEAEKAEMDALNLREAVLAGHVAPVAEPVVLDPAVAGHALMMEKVASGFSAIATILPGARYLAQLADELRAYVGELRAPTGGV